MPASGLDVTEKLRLDSLYSYAILGTPEELVFDNITALAASLCLAPASVISFLDHDRHWIKSHYGPVQVKELPRAGTGFGDNPAGHGLVEVRDIRQDLRLQPFTQLLPGMTFFAAVPLVDADGLLLGYLSVLDTKVRRLFSVQRSALEKLASAVMALLEAKKKEYRMVQLGSLLDRSNNEISLWDAASLRIQYANRGACRNLQYSMGELQQMFPWDLNPQYTRDVLERALAPLKDGRQSYLEFEGALQRKDGSRYPIEVRLEISRDRDSAQIVAIASDITARKQAETRLEENRQSYKSLFDHNPFPVFSLDLEGHFISYNLACIRLVGYARQDFTRLSFVDLVIPEQRSRVRQHLVLAGQGLPQGYECQIRHQDGQDLSLAVTHLPIVVNGRITGVYGIARDISQRKQAETALRESEERFRAAFEQAAVGMAQTRMDGAFVSVNRKLCDITGYRPEELCRLSFQLITHPEEVAESRRQLARMASGRIRHFSRQKRYIHKNGSVIWANLTVALCDDPHGQPSHFISIIEDITDRMRTEQALRDSQQRLELAMRAAGLGNWEWDLETDRVWCSQQTAGHLGLAADSGLLTHQEFLERVHPEDRPLLEAAHQKAFHDNEPMAIEYRIMGPGGASRWLEAQAMIERNADWPGGRMLGVSMDISARKQAEAALRQSEAQYRITFEAAPVGIATLDAAGRWLQVNQKLCEIVGYTAAELMQMNCRDVVYPADREKGEELRQQLLLQRIPGYSLEKRYVHKNGDRIWVNLTATALHDPHGGLLYHMISVEDVTRRKHYEQSLRELSSHLQTARETERTRIAREIHDELGGALTAIKFDLSLAKVDGPGSGQGQAGTIQLVDDAIGALRRIITDLRPSILDNVGLWAALEWQAQEFQSRIGIPCRFRMQMRDPVQLDADRSTAIFRIFQETLTNVARHAEASEVRVLVTASRQGATIKVADNGRGITRTQIYHSRSYGILGMRERARAHNGSIRFSNRPGGGTTVLIRFPEA